MHTMLLSKWRLLHETGSVILLALLIRWMISINSYSGKGKSPMYGDFEAQRHWMEITWNLPIKDWYYNTTENDLNYWGLDYPPLTAYHSWVCGFIANLINPEWIALYESRGYESKSQKIFMRTTVFFADLIIYIPAICALIYQRRTANGGFPYVMKICSEIFVALLSPGLILIDHGHFQYNCVSLGLTAWAIYAVNRKDHILGAVLFSLALNYKQMSLYLALPFFFYLLGICWQSRIREGLMTLVGLAVAVLATFTVCWWPFLWNLKDANQVLQRLFPFSRGIFEDKVANIWCALNVLVKLKSWNISYMAAASAIATFAVCLVSCFDIFRRPNDQRFKYALVNCGLAFFLFSFQVHEKSILLAALPATLLLPDDTLACTWFLSAAALSMFHLLLKDGLALPCYALVVLFIVSSLASLDWKHQVSSDPDEDVQFEMATALMTLSLGGFVGLSLACQFAPVFPQLPDLWPLLLSVYSFGHFLVFLTYFHVKQFGAEPILFKTRMSNLKFD